MTAPEDSRKPDLDRALQDPQAIFGTPEALLDHDMLTQQEKIEILRRWEYDASENYVAVEEGMPDGEDGLLQRILQALDKLTKGFDAEQISPSKQHGLTRSSITKSE
ncbi:MAG: hypothetical protein ACQETX_13505 [Pseudomonadota bacterium]